ncbi:hypothetical protein V5O48_009884 [Marasmius crinis-equi]|uniref:Rpr2-domain-containing protein n=1 Tax=Marasmius crinis-equi TaxID=585013 RepID=A0ABR3FAC3_9AGAR
MAKKDKNEAPNPNAVANRDIIHRLNFLYQASVYLNGMDQSHHSSSAQSEPEPSASTSTPMNMNISEEQRTESRKKRRKPRKIGIKDLARSYIDTMKVVGTKTTVRMDPSIKRTLCKGCNTVLVPGSTASVRVKSSPTHGHIITYTCLECQALRRLPAPPVDATPLESLNPRQLKKSVKPLTPPLFARNVGHVVFCGEKEITVEHSQETGNGVFNA